MAVVEIARLRNCLPWKQIIHTLYPYPLFGEKKENKKSSEYEKMSMFDDYKIQIQRLLNCVNKLYKNHYYVSAALEKQMKNQFYKIVLN